MTLTSPRSAAAVAAFLFASILGQTASAQSAGAIRTFNQPARWFSQSLGKLYFVANRSLWLSDGTAAGTAPIAPSSTFSAAGQTAALDGICYFLGAANNSADQEPWRSDGTLAGTYVIADLWPGQFSSDAGGFSPYRGRILFSANIASGQYHTFITDGTTAGTVQIGPGAQNPGSGPFYVVAGDYAYFIATDLTNGQELWKTDGTPAGTTLVLDIRPGASGSNPVWLIEHGGQVFLQADDGVNGAELWKSDGSVAGTTLVLDIRSGNFGSVPSYLVSSGDYVYFAANDGLTGQELWRSDGSIAGTIRLTDEPMGNLAPRQLTDLKGNCVFSGATAAAGREMWIADGTTGTAMMIQDTRPGALGSVQIINTGQPFAAIGDKVYYPADDGTHGIELWLTDGTSAGTMLGVDTVPGPNGGGGGNARVLNGKILFDGITLPSFNQQLWAWTGRANTQVVGRGCGNYPRIPTIAGTDPVLGSTWRVSGGRAFGGAAAVLTAGAPSAARVPLPFGDCALYADPSTLVVSPAFVIAQPSWSINLTIPNVPTLTDVLLSWQAVYVGTDNPGVGWDASPGLYVNLGS